MRIVGNVLGFRRGEGVYVSGDIFRLVFLSVDIGTYLKVVYGIFHVGGLVSFESSKIYEEETVLEGLKNRSCIGGISFVRSRFQDDIRPYLRKYL